MLLYALHLHSNRQKPLNTLPSFTAPTKLKTKRRLGRKPSTVAEFVHQALANPPLPPPKPPRPPRAPGRYAGIWDTFETAEERSAYARQLAAKRNPKNMARPHSIGNKGTAKRWTKAASDIARAAARLEATELVARLKTRGLIAKDDLEGQAATIEALTILRSPGGIQRKRKYANELLRHYHSELAQALV